MYRIDDLLKKLKEQYDKHDRLIIAYDFDDTICEFNPEDPYNQIPGKHQDVIDLLNLVNDNINAKFICYTARKTCDQTTAFIKNYCKKYNIPLDTINENIINWHKSPSKLFFNILLDDKAGLQSCCHVLQRFVHLYGKKNNQLSDGSYYGILDGNDVKINIDGKIYNYKIQVEIKEFNIKCIVHIENNEIKNISY